MTVYTVHVICIFQFLPDFGTGLSAQINASVQQLPAVNKTALTSFSSNIVISDSMNAGTVTSQVSNKLIHLKQRCDL